MRSQFSYEEVRADYELRTGVLVMDGAGEVDCRCNLVDLLTTNRPLTNRPSVSLSTAVQVCAKI